MGTGAIVGGIDVAQVTLYVFWIFFAGLIWYLRKEDRREGYPLENDVTGKFAKDPWLFMAAPKVFRLPHGESEVSFPNTKRDDREIAAERTAPFPGAPIRPTGDPLVDGVGPAAWAERADRPDVSADGAPRLAPMRMATEFSVAEQDVDPRGMPVFGCDRAMAGVVSDIWIDRAESLIRYLEADIGGRSVMLPMGFVRFRSIRGGGKGVFVNALTSAQMANVPTIATADKITLLEEDKIMGYFGGGMLYATPQRQEAVL